MLAGSYGAWPHSTLLALDYLLLICPASGGTDNLYNKSMITHPDQTCRAISTITTALPERGENVEVLAGFAEALRVRAGRAGDPCKRLADRCGTWVVRRHTGVVILHPLAKRAPSAHGAILCAACANPFHVLLGFHQFAADALNRAMFCLRRFGCWRRAVAEPSTLD